jgi:tol-pal system protein YbgF
MTQPLLSVRRLLPVLAITTVALCVPPVTAQDYGYGAPPTVATAYETRLSAVEDQLRALTGKVEQLDFAVRRIDQAVSRLQGDTDQRLKVLESLPPPVAQPSSTPAAAPSAAPTQPVQGATGVNDTGTASATGQPANPETSVRGTLGAIRVQDGHVVGGAVSPRQPPLPETPEGYGLSPQEQYDRAFTLLRQANYDEAERTFKLFIDKNPNDKLIDNAKYWYAETFYVRAKFNEAAVAFADAYQQNVKGSKAPDSLLKLAMSLSGLDKVQDACTTLNELRRNYPQAPATIKTRADQERARLKCAR